MISDLKFWWKTQFHIMGYMVTNFAYVSFVVCEELPEQTFLIGIFFWPKCTHTATHFYSYLNGRWGFQVTLITISVHYMIRRTGMRWHWSHAPTYDSQKYFLSHLRKLWQCCGSSDSFSHCCTNWCQLDQLLKYTAYRWLNTGDHIHSATQTRLFSFLLYSQSVSQIVHLCRTTTSTILLTLSKFCGTIETCDILWAISSKNFILSSILHDLQLG